jgi:hypothetical protein
MLLKEKNGVMKCYSYANGCKQLEYIAKRDASSLTVAIDSVLLSGTFDLKEGKDVANSDISGAFLQSNINKKVHMWLDKTIAEMLVKIKLTILAISTNRSWEACAMCQTIKEII